jgi:hypothetical protein
MSALGQKQTWQQALAMSALPPKADIDGFSQNVRFVPKADIRRQDNAGGKSSGDNPRFEER